MESSRYLVQRKVGRLLEARVFHLATETDADDYATDLAHVVAALPDATAGVLCADHRFAAIYDQPVADRLLDLFRSMNPRLERVAILVAPHQATFHMQLNRIVREANNPARQVFREPREAVEHLGVVLDRSELARARRFIDTAPPAEHPR